MTPTAEYARLFGYYLGDGHIARAARYSALRITSDTKHSEIIRDIENVVAAVHPNGRTHRVIAPGCVVIQANWKHWPCLFPQHGPGRKHERQLGMTEWQWATVEVFPADFLRGLFHSDGCLVQNRVYKDLRDGRRAYVYPRWQFVNASDEIRGWCCDALDLVGVAWKQSNPRVISVSRRADVARLTDLIGVKA